MPIPVMIIMIICAVILAEVARESNADFSGVPAPELVIRIIVPEDTPEETDEDAP